LEKEVSFFEVETWALNYFIHLIFDQDLDGILDELEEFSNFIETYGVYLGAEKEEYIDILEALFDIVEEFFDLG
jgi:hypothetical protein